MIRRAAVLGIVVCPALAAGCTPNIESLNSKAKTATNYHSPQAVYDAMTAAGVAATAFVDKGAAAGPGGMTMYSSGERNLGDGFATILVFPSGAAQKDMMDGYVTDWLSEASSVGVKDPIALVGTNLADDRRRGLSKVQEALGGQLQKWTVSMAG
jgi:hypothetical protein